MAFRGVIRPHWNRIYNFNGTKQKMCVICMKQKKCRIAVQLFSRTIHAVRQCVIHFFLLKRARDTIAVPRSRSLFINICFYPKTCTLNNGWMERRLVLLSAAGGGREGGRAGCV